MICINIQNVSLSFGGPAILDKIHLQIQENEKVALVGRNGQGKSTLMKLIRGDLTPDSGEVQRNQGLQVSYLVQEVPQNLEGTIFDILVQGLGNVGKAIIEYNTISDSLTKNSGDDLLEQFAVAQQKLDESGGWEEIQNVEEIISHLHLNPDERFEHLSAGKKRRVLLGQCLVKKPDLLLLDEPTNHLDIPSIQWLEEFFSRYSGTILLITHDRHFLKKIATRIIELDNGHLTSWDCAYEIYLERKAALIEANEKHEQEFDKKMAQEEVWIRKGTLARRTRDQGRVKRLKEMREQYRQRRKKLGSVKMLAQNAERSGNLVLLAENLNFFYEDKPIISDFSITITRGDKIGIIGANGCGKTTLLQILLGKLSPQKGNIKHGTNLQIAYFDQLRNILDREKSIFDNIGEGNDVVLVNGQKKHVMGYLQDFLFSPKDANNPVWTLSGGEQNRLLLAKLFLISSNVLVLDEPTNDLDIDTLDLLEQLLIDYKGTVFIVSHDRSFLNNVATSSIVFENGCINEYAGGYDDWLLQRPQVEDAKKKKAPTYQRTDKKKKLSLRDKKELEEIPAKIEELEVKQKELCDIMGSPDFYQKENNNIAEIQKKVEQIAQQLEKFYMRWEELEEMNSASS